MTFQAINLGTPNNNDGDSLYAGGVKLNANFSELYTAVAGSSGGTVIRIDLSASGLVTGNSLRFSASQGKFVSVSSTSLRSLGANGATLVYLTNNLGVAGADNELTGAPNTEYHYINGRLMMTMRARTTGSTTSSRAEIHYGLGLSAVTSMSVYTSGVVVRGFNGLTVYSNALQANEDVPSYELVMSTTGTGVILYNSPILSSNALKASSDSSAAIAHTGFVKQNLNNYPVSSTTISTQNGITGGGDISTNRTFGIDPRYYPEYIDGFLYDVDAANNIRVRPGSAVHFSYSTTGATAIAPSSRLAVVATSSLMLRAWSTGWTTTAGTPAIIDTTAALPLNTWYYIFLIGSASTGAVDYTVSVNRDIASVSSLLFTLTGSADLQVVRRIGVLKTDPTTVGQLVKFVTHRVGGNVIRQEWSLKSSNPTGTSGVGMDATLTVSLNASNLTPLSSSAAVTLNSYSSAVLTLVPPIQGVTAKVNLNHYPSASLPVVYMYPEAWVSSGVTVLPPFQFQRSPVANTWAANDVFIPMTPDNSQISDTLLVASTTSTGARIRQILIVPGLSPLTASGGFRYYVHGFDLAR